MGSLFNKGTSRATELAQQARNDELERQARIRLGNERVDTIFGQFGTPEFFDGRRQSFLNYAQPQLDEQFGEANKQLGFALARSGLENSSVRAQKAAELQKRYDLARQQIGDQALSYEVDARNNVEKARSDIVSMLNATGDFEGAANSAMARAQALSAPQAFSPLSQMFADLTGGLAQQANIERTNSLFGSGVGQPQIGRYNTGLFGNTKSVTVKR